MNILISKLTQLGALIFLLLFTIVVDKMIPKN